MYERASERASERTNERTTARQRARKTEENHNTTRDGHRQARRGDARCTRSVSPPPLPSLHHSLLSPSLLLVLCHTREYYSADVSTELCRVACRTREEGAARYCTRDDVYLKVGSKKRETAGRDVRTEMHLAENTRS